MLLSFLSSSGKKNKNKAPNSHILSDAYTYRRQTQKQNAKYIISFETLGLKEKNRAQNRSHTTYNTNNN